MLNRISHITKNLFFGTILIFFIYLIAWPIPIDPVAWTPQSAPNLEGNYSINNFLSNVKLIRSDNLKGPEDVAVDNLGRIYCGYSNGKILMYSSEGIELGIFADTKGRPLGLDFDNFGNLIVADAHRGLLSINKTGKIKILATKVDGISLNFTDDVDVAPDGLIYFTEASSKFNIHQYREDLFEHRPHGKLIKYDPYSKKSTLLLDSLYFSNGVSLSQDGDYLLFTETYDYSISKYWLKGPNTGKREKILNNLPGFPDGISTGSNGIFWVAIFTPRHPYADALAPRPFLRKIIYRLPLFFQPGPIRHGFILGIDSNGTVIHNLQDTSSRSFSPITSVEEYNGNLYLGSLTYPGAGIIKVPRFTIIPSRNVHLYYSSGRVQTNKEDCSAKVIIKIYKY